MKIPHGIDYNRYLFLQPFIVQSLHLYGHNVFIVVYILIRNSICTIGNGPDTLGSKYQNCGHENPHSS